MQNRLVVLLPQVWSELRDRGMAHMACGHTEQALADLELYLEHADQHGRDGLQQQINGLRGALNGSK